MKKLSIVFFLIFLWSVLHAQVNFPENGAPDPKENFYLLKGAILHPSPETDPYTGDVLIRNGKIITIGQNLTLPTGAIVLPLEGKHLYPSFIDMNTHYGIPAATFPGTAPSKQQLASGKKGPFSWNESLIPEYDASSEFQPDSKEAEKYRATGIGTVLTHRNNGIVQGSGLLTTLAEERPHQTILNSKASAHLSFTRAKSHQSTPTSQMGMIALLRQLYLDGEWYQVTGKSQETNLSYEAWNNLQGLPQIFSATDKLEILRAARIAGEFNKLFILKGAGDEYQRADEIAATGMPLIIPVDFPKACEVEDPLDAELVSLQQLMHWERAPANPSVLEKKGIPFALTSDGLEDLKDFLPNIRKAIRYGLSEKEALRALTTRPAKWLHEENALGQIREGFWANILVADGPVFEPETRILDHWIQGHRYSVHPERGKSANVSFEMILDGKSYKVRANSQGNKATLTQEDGREISGEIKEDAGRMLLTFPTPEGYYYRISGRWKDNRLSGHYSGRDVVQKHFETVVTREENHSPGTSRLSNQTLPESELIYPFTAYGRSEFPTEKTYYIRNVTAWTNTYDGIQKNTNVLIKNGEIAAVGYGAPPEEAEIVEGEGMHLTPGIIDEHSHIAISKGVNEGSLASSAAVRIGDVINSEDINIYRQLAGGVTTSQLLHGSANPIGGQAALIKLRWGYSPEDLKFEGADPFIKFALGENVKQSNWGEKNTVRFPQTRMGVEQVYEDYFTRAREYGKRKKAGRIYRKDLEMETLLEILNGERFITCHSYVQSEITMLLRMAERFGFRINTLTHILEGYKVADKIKEHGAAAGTFSDWWAYKYEVIDAIPYNATILHDAGVLTAINSDDAEMGRRLHSEAGKTIKYGGLSEEEALKLVTLNPAKMLHIDHRVGKIEVGMDADLVLWNGNPLSSFSRAEKTFIDGKLFFDREENEKTAVEIRKERARLIQKMIREKKGDSKSPSTGTSKENEFQKESF